eukprot:TRINITY_DN71091_c0_g1_i1.p1 TRINITY_DN71091_c0_g1~~TRINITY_DN71091_c0_g1_i1.p1  ORF type:complete len:269 (-),score=32.18 TRINITY_DN71091_c0_g1_i1:51-857(-)
MRALLLAKGRRGPSGAGTVTHRRSGWSRNRFRLGPICFDDGRRCDNQIPARQQQWTGWNSSAGGAHSAPRSATERIGSAAAAFAAIAVSAPGVAWVRTETNTEPPVNIADEGPQQPVVVETQVENKPKKKPCRSSAHVPPENPPPPATQEQVAERLGRSPVVIFIKGTPERPRCGFSRAMVEVLRCAGVEFDYVDVLEEPEFREAMKVHWPTFPQLWAEGTLLGGTEAIRNLARRGELRDALKSSTARERASLALLFSPAGFSDPSDA